MTRKITSVEDLKALRSQAQQDIALRAGEQDMQVTVHMGTCGIAAGARDILLALAEELRRAGLTNVALRQSGCIGLCDREPMLTLTDKAGHNFIYGTLDKNKVQEIVREHIQGGQPLNAYVVRT
jgi:NADP-reducing hydrogenase subunit HndB